MLSIILLGLTSLLTDISTEMVYPLLPLYLVYKLGSGPQILGFIEGIAESLASLLKVFSGYFSDKIKRRLPFAIFGYLSSTIGKFFLYLSTNWLYVFIARVIDRFGKGIRTAPRDALIAESIEANKKGMAFGLHRALDTLGASLGVLFAYFLLKNSLNNFKNIFLFSLIPAILGIVFLFFVKEKKEKIKIIKEKPSLKWNLLNKKLKLFLIFTFIFTLGNSSNHFLLLRAKTQGVEIDKIILLYLFYNLIYTLTSYPAASLSDKIGRKRILILGYFFYGLVYLGFALNHSVNNFWFLFGLYGFYIGFTEGTEKALIADISPSDLKASALGLHATLVGIGLFPASLFAGIIWKFFGPELVFYLGGFLGILSSIGLYFILKD